MIKQIKMGIRLLPYTHGLMTNCLLAGGVLLLGGICVFLGETMAVMGAYLMMAGAMCLVQMLYSIGVSNMVQTSSWKKPLQTSVMAWLYVISSIVIFAIIILLQLPGLLAGGQKCDSAALCILMGGMSSGLFGIYLGFALKYFVASTVAFVISVSIFFQIGNIVAMNLLVLPLAAIVGGLVCIGLGALGMYGASRLVYRKPIAKNSQLSGLKQTM